MSDKSDEELVGDVDFDFDLVEDTINPVEVTKTVKQVEKHERKNPASTRKPPVAKKKAVKVAMVQDDLLQAFAIGATSVKKVSQPDSSVKKKTNVNAKNAHGKVIATHENKGDRTKGENQGERIKQEYEGERIKQENQGERIKQENQGERMKQEYQGEMKTQEKRGEIKKQENQGEIIKQENQGEKMKQEYQGEMKTQEKRGELKKEENGGERIKRENQEERIKQEYQGEMKRENREKLKEQKYQGEMKTKENREEIKNSENQGEKIKQECERTNQENQGEKIKEEYKGEIKTQENQGEIKKQGNQGELKKTRAKDQVAKKSETVKNTSEVVKTVTKQGKHCDEMKTTLKTPSKGSKNSDKNIQENSFKEESKKVPVTRTENIKDHTPKTKDELNKKVKLCGKNEKGPGSSSIKIVEDKTKTQAVKRKAEDAKDKDSSAKMNRIDISAEVSRKDTNIKDDLGSADVVFTEDDYKNMDNFLTDQMFKKSREKITSRSGVKYTVHVSPLEIADLAHPSLQQLIQLHPTMSLIFKHQTVKFRKKKGFAEAAFTTMTELKEFVYQLTQIKVFEKRIDVTIKTVDQSDILSFVIHLNRNGKLLNLLDTGEDPLINKPMPSGKNPHKIQFEKVPNTVNGAFMHSMFPFTNNVLITRTRVGKDANSVYHGPVSVFYINSKWLEAVMECCSDFTVNGFPLTVIGDFKTDERLKRAKSGEKRKSTMESDQRSKQIIDTEDCIDDDDNDDDDDPVSNMTRDVCVDMLESIQKLRDLEPNNPNMEKILEMQKQLNALQNSLGKSQSLGTKQSTSKEENENSKKAKLNPTEKKQRGLQDLEEKFEEAEKAEWQKIEEIRQKREMEILKKREFDQKRKTQWAKNMLSDFKKQEGAGDRISANAEKILQQREQRIKEREEEEKRRVEEVCRQEEEERAKKELEEKRREAERKRLIEKIEETRLRDSEKFSTSQLMWNPSSSKAVDDDVHSPSKFGSSESMGMRGKDGDQHFSKRESASRLKDAGSSAVIDDGVDDRLADFARELMQQGKIESEAPISSNSRRSTDRRFPSTRGELQDELIISEEEYQNLVANNQIHSIDETKLKVRLTYIPNRLCPVQGCPSKTNFRDIESFMDHWLIFHQAQTSMRFCPRCSAYFMNSEELENHIMKHHRCSFKDAIELVRNARMKVIPNPSYRDPFPFLPPLSH